MVNPNIATSAEQPINRDGAVSTLELEEGDIVGLNEDGELVSANADGGSGTVVAAMGVMLNGATDLQALIDQGMPQEYTDQIKVNKYLVGEHKVTYVTYGVEVVNADQDWDFTPGQPVYLGADGTFTQDTVAQNAGNVEQVLGMAAPDGETVWLDVSYNYNTVTA